MDSLEDFAESWLFISQQLAGQLLEDQRDVVQDDGVLELKTHEWWNERNRYFDSPSDWIYLEWSRILAILELCQQGNMSSWYKDIKCPAACGIITQNFRDMKFYGLPLDPMVGQPRPLFRFIHCWAFSQHWLQQTVDDHWAFPHHDDSARLQFQD